MAKVNRTKQINLTLPNRVGTMAKVSKVISDAGANISALSARGDKRRAYFHLLVDRHIKVKNALTKAGFGVTSEDVILVEMSDKPGQMQIVAEKVAEGGIDILYTYGSAGSGRTSVLVLKTDNDKKAIKLIQGK